MHSSFCTFKPRSPEDALEETLLLDSIAWPENPILIDAGVAGQIVDNLNGSYSALFSSLWEGKAQVKVMLKSTCLHFFYKNAKYLDPLFGLSILG